MAFSARLRNTAALSGVCALASCLAPAPVAESLWPPPDYYLEVRLEEDERETVRVRFFADGLVVYAEATDWIGGDETSGFTYPVFGRLSVYRMRSESIRQMSRLVDRAGIRNVSANQLEGGDLGSPLVVIHWRAFEGTGVVRAQGVLGSSVVRLLHIVNAYLPAGSELRLAGLSGDPEPRHLAEVPSPVESIAGSLDFHMSYLLDREPADADLMVDVFALGLRDGRTDVAAEMLRRLDDLLGDEPLVLPMPGAEEGDLRSQLRRLLEAAQA